MKIVQNDPTQNMARPAIIVAAIRAGGTFLSHCLSNHPNIYCNRGEPLHHGSSWSAAFNGDRRLLLRVLLNQTGYQISMCKLTYVQAFHRDIWPEIQRLKPWVIWLRRANMIRQALSVAINQQARAGQLVHPQHTFEPTEPVRIEIPPGQFLRYLDGLTQQNTRAEMRLSSLPHVLPMVYEEITSNPWHHDTAAGLSSKARMQICLFLGVPIRPMPTDLIRVNPGPLSELLVNWDEIRQAIMKSPYSELLEGERHWTN